MRASELIELLQNMIQLNGDRYVVYESENSEYGMSGVETIEVTPYYETEYFCIK